jgi:hypothetical protein
MSNLDSMFERNEDLSDRLVCCRHTYALAPAGAAECKGKHRRVR